MIKFGLDLDGTLRRFDYQINRLMVERGANIPLDKEPQTYDAMFEGKEGWDKKLVQEVWNSEQTRLFRDAPAFEGAKDFVESMVKLGDVVFITKQETEEAGKASEEWVSKNIGDYPVIRVTDHSKWRYCDVLIDDYTVNLNEARAHGVAGLCVARPYNEDYPAPLRGDYEYLYRLCSIIKALGASQLLARHPGRA